MKTIYQGAEAIIKTNGKKIIKERASKSYRHPEIDKKIIKKRTKAEIKIIKKASEIISVPQVEDQINENTIVMEKINGKKLSKELDLYPLNLQKKILFEIGKTTSKIHREGIIHGDLTTSNMIYVEKEKKVYFIDFGLSFLNGKIEDMGVDVHLLKQALEAKHFKNWEILFREFEKGYNSINKIESKKVFTRLNEIEKRGRYKH